MIEFENVTKTVRPRGQRPRDILSSVSLEIAANRRIALLGEPHEDRMAVIDMLAGIVLPTSGRVVRHCRVSYPVGFLGGFSPELSVRVNVAHTAKLYDVDPRTLVEFVERAAAVGVPFDKPFIEMPNHLKRQLGLILSFAVPFDVYLMKNDLSRIRANPKDNFRATLYELFEARARTSGMIIAVSAPAFAREYCDMALVLHHGQLVSFDDIEEAFVALERLRYHEAVTAAAR
jgi:capsular polysaccharide transport system ATP-binding protein